jgi:hypothetical protein
VVFVQQEFPGPLRKRRPRHDTGCHLHKHSAIRVFWSHILIVVVHASFPHSSCFASPGTAYLVVFSAGYLNTFGCAYMYVLLRWCTRGAEDCLSRMGLPFAPPATGGSPPVGGPFCAIARTVPPARNAATIVKVFRVVRTRIFYLPFESAQDGQVSKPEQNEIVTFFA